MSGFFCDLSRVSLGQVQRCRITMWKECMSFQLSYCSQGWPKKQGLNTNKLFFFNLDPSGNSAEELGLDLIMGNYLFFFLRVDCLICGFISLLGLP